MQMLEKRREQPMELAKYHLPKKDCRYSCEAQREEILERLAA
jgi:hypothetical protein